MKVSPKSCSCQQCKRGKHSKGGHALKKADEHAVRHKVNSDLAKFRGKEYNLIIVDELEELETPTVPIGNYYD